MARRRRNSDPAPGAPERRPELAVELRPELRPADPRSTDYIGQTGNGLFRIAGHRYTQIHICNKYMEILNYNKPIEALS